MDAIFAQALKDTTTLRKPSVPWTPDQPSPQPYYTFDPTTSTWTSPPSTPPSPCPSPTPTITNIAIHTWNIDFMLPFATARMKPALAHLHDLTTTLPPGTAPIIFLQECTPTDLTTIASTPWIQQRFHITDLTHAHWATSHYGTTTLIDARLSILSVFRIHYAHTRMDRDALFVDIALPASTPSGGESKTLRVCNTHLESMALDPPYRPLQMRLIAKTLHEKHIHAGLVAGDFNAIQPFDRTLHVDDNNDLKDAFLELGGEEDTEEGYTWGQQAATTFRERFGCSRMDKVYYCGGWKVLRFERFGEGVLTLGEEEQRQIIKLGFERAWVTDHLGVVAEFEID